MGLGLRTRVTLLVSVTFAIATAVLALVALNRVESALVDDARSNSEQILTGYLESVYGGVAAVGVVGNEAGSQFFYRDANGDPIDEITYFELLTSNLDEEFSSLVGTTAIGPPEVVDASPDALPPANNLITDGVSFTIGDVQVLESGELLDPTGDPITLIAGPTPQGSPETLDLGDDVVAISQELAFGDGTMVSVGVSSPLKPVTNSIDAFAKLIWLAVPLLVVAVGGATWLAASRALRPVHGISAQARAITADRLDERVPVPEAADEIHELAETVNAMLDRIERGQKRHRRLISDASHELRSPVAASRAQLEVAMASGNDEDWQTVAETVLIEQERLTDLVDDLLILTRLEEGEVDRTSLVDVGQIIADESARPRVIHPTSRTRPGVDAKVFGNARLLERLMRNLLDNAARHADGRVEISLQRTTDSVRFHVDDDGAGIDPQHRDTIFERFTRLDEARDHDGGGSGLGLAIVREVATAHGGSVDCAESPIGGARFTVSLPARGDAVHAARA